MAGELPLYGRHGHGCSPARGGKKNANSIRGVTVEVMLTLYIAIFVTLSVLYHISRRSDDPYGAFHLSFNRVPGSPDLPRTEWLNMGFWKVPQCTSTF